MTAALAWLDGEVRPLAETRVSIEDRSFLFADGVYEVVRAYGGRPFALDDHLARFARSAAGIALAMPFEPARFGAIAADLLARTGLDDAEIYMQLTRGAARRNHLFPADVPASALVWVQPMRALDPQLAERGVAVVSLPDERWARCHLKTVSLLPNVLAKEQARRMGAFEALLVRDGLVTEGTSCNVFAVLGGEVATPVADQRILAGVTRARLLALAAELGLACRERDIPHEALADAEELFLASTMMELMPVASLDGRQVGAGAPGPITRRLAEAFRAHVRTCLET